MNLGIDYFLVQKKIEGLTLLLHTLLCQIIRIVDNRYNQ